MRQLRGPLRVPALAFLLGYLAGCQAHSPAVDPPPLPASVDLRPEILALGFVPRSQGPRGTCSIFTTCSAIEFALAKHRGKPDRLSPEFVNWAAGQAAGQPSDGNFFHNALAGFDKFGVCAERTMPYRPAFDANAGPAPEALSEGARVRDSERQALAVHWIVPWVPNHFGVNDAQFAQVKEVLAAGFPVAAGSGHSRLLVGYHDDVNFPGGGAFWTLDSGLGRFDRVTYEFVRNDVADVFWIGLVDSTANSAANGASVKGAAR